MVKGKAQVKRARGSTVRDWKIWSIKSPFKRWKKKQKEGPERGAQEDSGRLG